VWQRYRGERPALRRVIWCQHAPVSEIPADCELTLALREAGTFHVGFDGWQEVRDLPTVPNSLGLHIVNLDAPRLVAGRSIDLTYRSGSAGAWAGRNFRILVTPGARS
jgi:glucoamylase